MRAPRVAYCSDLHIEFWQGRPVRSAWAELVGLPLGLGPDLRSAKGSDLLVLAGDIGLARHDGWHSALDYAEAAAAWLGCPAVLVPGNHEYHGQPFQAAREALLAGRPGVRVLDRGEAAYGDGRGGLRVLGCTLWTDYAALGDARVAMAAAASRVSDHRRILGADGKPGFTPEDALAEHLRSRAWLEGALAEPWAGRTLVVTHHVPTLASRNPGFPRSALSPAFHSRLDALVALAGAAGCRAWVYGHHHWNPPPLALGGVRLVTAQMGYPGENTAFAGIGVIDL